MGRSLLVLATSGWLATAALGQELPPGQEDRDALILAAREIMERARFCTVITLDGEGRPRARIMDPVAPAPDMTVWLATNARTRKVEQIRADPRVTLLYFDPADPSYVTILGTASIVTDPAEKARRWQEGWADFYPGGPEGDVFTLIRVDPQRLEIVSESRGYTSDPETWLPAGIELR